MNIKKKHYKNIKNNCIFCKNIGGVHIIPKTNGKEIYYYECNKCGVKWKKEIQLAVD